jgi:hypothetical protein
MPHNGYADQRQIRLEEVVRIPEGRSPSAQAARALLPKETSSWAASVGPARLDLSVCSGLLHGVLAAEAPESRRIWNTAFNLASVHGPHF